MSYLTSSSSPKTPSKRKRYELPTGNATNNTYDHNGEEFDIYEPSQPQTHMEPTSRRQQGV